MFEGLINDAKSAAGSVIAKYLARASVAVPFLVALGFATAAVTLMLVERFGAITAYWAVAGAFALIGLVATLIVTAKEHGSEVKQDSPETKPAQSDATAASSAEPSPFSGAFAEAPLAILGTLVSSPLGRIALASGLKMGVRNLPLVLMLAVLGVLLWPSDASVPAADEEASAGTDPDTYAAPAAPNLAAA